jgi:hypothetical protein
MAASSIRLEISSLVKMCERCVFTVLRRMKSLAAISGLLRPSTTRLTTCILRGCEAGPPGGGAVASTSGPADERDGVAERHAGSVLPRRVVLVVAQCGAERCEGGLVLRFIDGTSWHADRCAGVCGRGEDAGRVGGPACLSQLCCEDLEACYLERAQPVVNAHLQCLVMQVESVRRVVPGGEVGALVSRRSWLQSIEASRV